MSTNSRKLPERAPTSFQRFVRWPPPRATRPSEWCGTAVRSLVADPVLPRAVRLEAKAIVERLSRTQPLAIWLSGSAVRGRLTRRSDIDWVAVTEDGNARLPRGWP